MKLLQFTAFSVIFARTTVLGGKSMRQPSLLRAVPQKTQEAVWLPLNNFITLFHLCRAYGVTRPRQKNHDAGLQKAWRMLFNAPELDPVAAHSTKAPRLPMLLFSVSTNPHFRYPVITVISFLSCCHVQRLQPADKSGTYILFRTFVVWPLVC